MTLEIGPIALLQTVAGLGTGSASLVAWELGVAETSVTEAWAAAVRDGWLRPAYYELAEDEWSYELSEGGQAQLDVLDRADQSAPGVAGATVTQLSRKRAGAAVR